MTEQNPTDRPGHLDIDAVSAYVDRDFAAHELAMLAFHLQECSACQREVLEIRTTVMLLAGLPQYTPRRSFCLGHEHARASRRRSPVGHQPWSTGNLPPGYPAPALGAPPRGAGWLPGLQAAAVVIGALLLLVTSSDLFGMPPQPADWLDEQQPMPMEFVAAPPPQLAQPVPTAAGIADTDEPLAPAAPESESAIDIAAEQSGGTVGDDGASQGVVASDDPAQTAPAYATSAAIAAVTHAAPTDGILAREPASAQAREPGGSEPSRMRLVQIALAFALAWLIVSIVGLRWVRGVRGAPH
jgi:hypothetical protein